MTPISLQTRMDTVLFVRTAASISQQKFLWPELITCFTIRPKRNQPFYYRSLILADH
jgi:hypothetical protein